MIRLSESVTLARRPGAGVAAAAACLALPRAASAWASLRSGPGGNPLMRRPPAAAARSLAARRWGAPGFGGLASPQPPPRLRFPAGRLVPGGHGLRRGGILGLDLGLGL